MVANQRIERGLTIMDMTGGGVGTANKQVYGLVKLAAKVGSDYYPEIMGNLFLYGFDFFNLRVYRLTNVSLF